MRTFVAPLSALLVLAASGCHSSSSGGDVAAPALPAAGLVSSDANALTFATGPFEIPPGDSFTCFYLNVTTDRELSVDAATGTQGEGGHHVLVYYADTTREPTHHPCDDAEMVSWHQVAGSGGEGASGDVIALPPGMALRVAAGKQLVMQAHYINTSGKTQTVDDTVTLHLTDPKNVKAYMNYVALVNDSFELPAHTPTKASTTCTLSQDFTTLLWLGHMHGWGKNYALDRVDDAGNVLENLITTKWEPQYTSHPQITRFPTDAPRVLPKGTKLRQTCEWTNTTDAPIGFPEEMCVTILYYYPDVGSFTCSTDGGQTTLDGAGGNGAGGAGGGVPAASCVKPGDHGNSLGVGAPCTLGGGECKAFPKSGLCLADVGEDQWMCTHTGCKADADCGEAAHCHFDAAGSACVPDKCEAPGSGGAGGAGGAGGNSGVAGMAGSGGAGG
jgi:hypothetical protein